MNCLYCASVTMNLLIAKARGIVSLCCGPSLSSCPSSLGGEPIMKLPAGITTRSGQSLQSLNTVPGLMLEGGGVSSERLVLVPFDAGAAGCGAGAGATDATCVVGAAAPLFRSLMRFAARSAKVPFGNFLR